MKRNQLIRITVWVLFSLALISCDSKPENNAVHIKGKTMGTFWHVTLVKTGKQSIHTWKISRLIKQELKEINQQFSTYLPHSEISTFNSTHSIQPFAVSKAVVDVVEASQRLSQQTQGAFDITIAPLVNLWGFGPELSFKRPSYTAIKKTRVNTGYRQLGTHQDPPQLIKQNPLIHIDLSAIAKGYAVDKIATLIEQQGIKNYLVEIGGEIKVKGHNPKAEHWKIAIENPSGDISASNVQSAQEIMILSDNAVATSGDYRNYFEVKGVRYSHTIDPETGEPITHQLASVTVLHSSAMMADGIATAIMVLGEKKGLAFAKQHDWHILMLIREGEGFRTVSTLKPAMVTSSK